MNKEFIPYEQALALKELEFNEPCFGHYLKKQFYLKAYDKQGDGITLRPTFSQVFRFFREKYGLQHRIWSGKISKVFYGYDILNIDEQEFVINNTEDGGGDCDYVTYEEAELACLKKLIEIVKNK